MNSHYVNGQWMVGKGAEIRVYDPATGHQLWMGAAATAEDVDLGCRAAHSALHSWANTSLDNRITICQKFRDLLQQNSEQMAQQIAKEVGKPLWEARTEVTSMMSKVDISVQAYRVRTGESRTKISEGELLVRHRPHGVLGVLGPYNFPGHLPNGHIVPALIAGNTIVFKPSEYAPQTAIKTIELWERAGLPAGVLNLLNGGRDTGIALAEHSSLDGLLFTGSYQVGAMLHRQFAGRPGKILALEMGGNNAIVVWNVSHIDAAVHHAIFSAFVSAGQRCTCARRLIIQDSPQGKIFLERLIDVAKIIQVGPYDQNPPPFMGPVISVKTAEKLLQAQAEMIALGGVSLLQMQHLDKSTGFLSPGIVDVTDAKKIPDEEWFGPLLQVIRAPNFDAALAVANATEYGLAAALISDDEHLWNKFMIQVRAGIVNWNRPTTGAASGAPFGGIGKSGNHRPSAYYAADYCAYPVASIENGVLEMPKLLSPGLTF